MKLVVTARMCGYSSTENKF